MTELVNQPTKRTARKVQASAMGAGGAAALTQPLAEIVARIAVEIAPFDIASVETQIAMVATGIFATVGAWVAGYYTRERRENMLL